jgi:hypothetical protein
MAVQPLPPINLELNKLSPRKIPIGQLAPLNLRFCLTGAQRI